MSLTMPSANRAGNRLLNRLSSEEFERLAPYLEEVRLPLKAELFRQDGPAPYVYFPCSGMVSTIHCLQSGECVETSAVGNEGMLGLAVLLGVGFSMTQAIQQVAGTCYRIEASAFRRAVSPGGTLDNVLRKYAAYTIRHANQTVACNLRHTVEERTCRWLLAAHDRAGGDEFSLTQEFLAELLGVRRQSVTAVAVALQDAGLIAYRRGFIRVVDCAGLEAASCECYESIRRSYDRILE